jgi:RsiW-degrading membrane proteinase PrsW (M82 family)
LRIWPDSTTLVHPRGPRVDSPARMDTQIIFSAVTLLFIVGMIWLRTRMHYARQSRGVLKLQPVGRTYFAVVLAVLLLGWFVAPLVGHALWPQTTNVAPGLMRAVWFLAAYYMFIVVHRILQARGVEVFKVDAPSAETQS